MDFQFSDVIIDRSRSVDNLRLIPGNFGEVSIAEQVGDVDAIILFDVLLHQVKPDWNEVLEIYSHRTKYFIVYNQQWIRSKNTIRLLDLGREEYSRNINATAELRA